MKPYKPFWARTAKGELRLDCEGYPYPLPEEGGSPRCNTSLVCRSPASHMLPVILLNTKPHKARSQDLEMRFWKVLADNYRLNVRLSKLEKPQELIRTVGNDYY